MGDGEESDRCSVLIVKVFPAERSGVTPLTVAVVKRISWHATVWLFYVSHFVASNLTYL